MDARGRRLAGLLLAALWAATPPALTAETDLIEEVLVTGEQPGPGLWKVSSDTHVLWILGTYRPLPRDMRWQSRQVESRIAGSQEVLLAGSVDVRADIGLLRGLTLLPSLLRAAKNPDGATLADVLPPATYAKWLPLKRRYLGDDRGIEAYRPTFAAARLRSEAIKQSGLGYRLDVGDVVRSAAKRHRVRIRELPDVVRKVPIEDPRRALKNARTLRVADAECFDTMMDSLEPEIQTLKARANAWAVGDVAALRDAERRGAGTCFEALMAAVEGGSIDDAGAARKAIADARRESELADRKRDLDWFSAVQAALTRNGTTFAVLPMTTLLKSGGYLERLRALGYLVESP